MKRALLGMMLVLILTVPGCTTGIGGLGPRDSQALEVPAWEVGDWWLYTFETPEFGEDSARLVVTEEVDAEGHWMLGISSEREAQRHAVINHNPFLGRVTYDGLSVYENGMPQPVFSFPWTRGDTWSFTLFGMIWQAETVAVQGHEARMVANSGPDLLEITFDGNRGFIQELTWSTGPELNLRMTLTQSGAGHTGDVWFIRATDLTDERWQGLDGEASDTFFDSGHPRGEAFDFLVWYLDVDVDDQGQAGLTVTDRLGASPLTRAWGSGATEQGTIGTIPSVTGEYTTLVVMRGSDSDLHLKIAGGIETRWTLE